MRGKEGRAVPSRIERRGLRSFLRLLALPRTCRNSRPSRRERERERERQSEYVRVHPPDRISSYIRCGNFGQHETETGMRHVSQEKQFHILFSAERPHFGQRNAVPFRLHV